ncbi:c-type cytochrome [Celeribacter sp.]|uniref:c-type cytochrome n=1 Tax=Celeribacter sp. TaxID=1890673 RepID=UPI003A8D5EE0
MLDRDQSASWRTTCSRWRVSTAVPRERLEEGAMHFADNCSSCHGEDGAGIRPRGPGPHGQPLDLRRHRSGAVRDHLWRPTGWMPAWENRLTERSARCLPFTSPRWPMEAGMTIERPQVLASPPRFWSWPSSWAPTSSSRSRCRRNRAALKPPGRRRHLPPGETVS